MKRQIDKYVGDGFGAFWKRVAGLKQQKKVKAQVVEEEEVAAVEGAMAVQPRPRVTTSMRRSVGSMLSESLKPTLSTTSKRNTWGSEFQRRGLRACKKR